MAKKYDLAVKTGSYQVGRDTKNRYQSCGEIHNGEHGYYARINPYVMLGLCHAAIAGGNDSMLVSLFEPKGDTRTAGQSAQPEAQPDAQHDNFDDVDIPF